MNRLLAEDLPLRMARTLGDFAENKPLPHRYGDLSEARFPLIKLTASQWFAADHPMTVTAVFVDDEATAGWNFATVSDGAGHSWTVVNLAAPAPADAEVSACGTGKRHPDSGALIDNPADIFTDILRLAGRTSSWSTFRGECAAAGLRLAGSLDEIASIREHLDRVARSAGAIWQPDMARLYPTAVVAGPIVDLDKMAASNLQVSATVEDTCDVLRLGYDREDATGKPQKHMEFTASPQRLGGIGHELELPWLREPGAAEKVGKRLLARLAGERYQVAFNASRTDLRPGRWVRLLAHPEWPFLGADPVLMVLEVEVQLGAKSVAVVAEYVRAQPSVAVTAHSVALPSTTDAGVDVEFRNGTVTLTFVDNDGRPLGDARVSFDGGAAKRTDARGVVFFTATKGTHAVAVEATGMVPFTFEIVL